MSEMNLRMLYNAMSLYRSDASMTAVGNIGSAYGRISTMTSRSRTQSLKAIQLDTLEQILLLCSSVNKEQHKQFLK